MSHRRFFLSNSIGLEAPVVRLPGELRDLLGVEFLYKGTLMTTRMGSFVDLASYPWMFHAELGWWYLSPADNGFYFFARTTGSQRSWNWTDEASFPYVYSYQTGTWRYYAMNHHGWFYDYGDARWHFVDL